MSIPHKENTPFLYSSSHIFNQKRLELAKANQAVENARKRRLFDGVDEAISAEINPKNCQNKVGDIFTKQQKVITRFIDELLTLREEFKVCSKAQAKINQTDISQEDQKFLLQILREHGYISEMKPNLKLAEVFDEIIKKFNRNKKSALSEHSSSIKSAQEIENPLLENFRTSRFPMQNKLCSIAHQPNMVQNQKQKQCLANMNNKCSLQLDLDHINHQQEEEYGGVKVEKVSKRYYGESVEEDSSEIKSQPREDASVNQSSSTEGMKFRDDIGQHHAFGSRQDQQQKQISKMLGKIELPEIKSVKGNSRIGLAKSPNKQKFKEPLTPRKWNQSISSGTKEIFKISEIAGDRLLGKLGVMKCSIHWSSIQRVIWEHKSLQVQVHQFGLLFISFSNKKLNHQFMDSLISYSGDKEQE